MPDIVEVAIQAGNFKKLVAAVQAAGLTDTLKGPGPFTVFAPTDEAFDKLPKGTLESLMKDPNRLKQILLYHVVPGRTMVEQISGVKNIKTAEGEQVKVDAARWHLHRHIKVDHANIIKADIPADNGVCHAIDEVLMPKVMARAT